MAQLRGILQHETYGQPVGTIMMYGNDTRHVDKACCINIVIVTMMFLIVSIVVIVIPILTIAITELQGL